MSKAVDIFDRLHNNMIYLGREIKSSCRLVQEGRKRYTVYRIVKEPLLAIEIVSIGELYNNYDDFLAKLPNNEPRYAVYNLMYQEPSTRFGERFFFMLWCPDICDVKSRMIYASFFAVLKKFCVGDNILSEIQANEKEEAEFADVSKRLVGECTEVQYAWPLILQRLSKIETYHDIVVLCGDHTLAEVKPLEETEEIIIEEPVEEKTENVPIVAYQPVNDGYSEELQDLIKELTITANRLERIANNL